MTRLVTNIVQGPIITYATQDPAVPFASFTQLMDAAPAVFNPGGEAFVQATDTRRVWCEVIDGHWRARAYADGPWAGTPYLASQYVRGAAPTPGTAYIEYGPRGSSTLNAPPL